MNTFPIRAIAIHSIERLEKIGRVVGHDEAGEPIIRRAKIIVAPDEEFEIENEATLRHLLDAGAAYIPDGD